jgi:glutamate-1-semialdehyde 2,1-aminomutase
MKVTEGQALYRRAKKRIPGGTQLLSKRPEMLLPEGWPCYFSKARGVDVWDLDGNHYVDMSINGVGSCVLGAADHDVDGAVYQAVRSGVMSLLNAPEEVRLADLLCELHPWADMVRYTRSGGEALAVAVRICRAHTGRDKVAFCGYHGWHDWYLAANLAHDSALEGHLLPGLAAKGVPSGLKGTVLPFRYNRIDDLEAIIAEQGDELGTIIMEPQRSFLPETGFLEQVRTLADEHRLVLVFDEVTAAFRMNPGGLHLTLGVTPDVAVFAKAMSNGYPMGAVVGKEAVMQAAQETFISSTYWTDRIGPVAAIATIEKFRAEDVHKHLIAIGETVQAGWKKAANEAGLALEVSGMAPLAHFSFKGQEAQAARTLFTALMLDRGFLATNSLYVTYAHRQEHVKRYLDALSEVFGEVAVAWQKRELEERLPGPVAHDGFKRLA